VALGTKGNVLILREVRSLDLREYFEGGLSAEQYTALLNDDQRKLHALYERRVEIAAETIDIIRSADVRRVLIITEPWCGDSLAAVPVVTTLFRSAGTDVRVVRRDEHPELIDQYLTRGGRAIPIVILLDEDDRELSHWGPRPEPAQAILEAHRSDLADGRIERSEVLKKIRAFYAKDQGRTIVAEFVEQLTRS
jgi:hypothetical protein